MIFIAVDYSPTISAGLRLRLQLMVLVLLDKVPDLVTVARQPSSYDRHVFRTPTYHSSFRQGFL